MVSHLMEKIVVVLVLFLFAFSCDAKLTYQTNTTKIEVATPQLWYEGYWKQVGWLNGTVAHYPTATDAEAQGKILFLYNLRYPYEPMLRKLAKLDPQGVLIVQDRSGTPGFGMYAVDGKNRKGIDFPVAESYIIKGVNASMILDGAYVEISFEKNTWKTVNDTVLHPILGAILSVWELAIICVAIFRIHQFTSVPGFSILSIGPMCLTLELIGACIRFAHTIVDPYYSERMLPHAAQSVLLTIHLPFSLASGILLTFYWTETLRRNKVKATPFISDYKKSAIAVVIGLFVIEIATLVPRVVIHHPRINPLIFSLIYYVIVSIVLTVAYVMCYIAILRRIKDLGSRKYSSIRKMNLRFTMSAAGYIALIVFELIFYDAANRSFGAMIIFFLLYGSINWTSLFQVKALKPVTSVQSSSSSKSKFHSGSNSNSNTHATDASSVL